MVSDSWLKKFKDRFRKKPEEGELIPENWVDPLIQKETTEMQENGILKVIYEPKKTSRFIARRIKRLICFIIIIANFVMFSTCFFVEGGVMVPFFGANLVFLMDYFWKSRPMHLEQWK